MDKSLNWQKVRKLCTWKIQSIFGGRLWEMTRPDKSIAPLYDGMELDKNVVNRPQK
jgi:hypothetical protein